MKSTVKLSVKIVLLAIVGALAACSFVFASVKGPSRAFAEDVSYADETDISDENGDIEPYGLFANLSLAIGGGDGKVWATVRNDFTMFPSYVTVYVDLYSSDTYCQSYESMTVAASNYIDDLDMNNSITAECSTGGVQKYWLARMRYKVDAGSWKSEATSVKLYSADGTCLS